MPERRHRKLFCPAASPEDCLFLDVWRPGTFRRRLELSSDFVWSDGLAQSLRNPSVHKRILSTQWLFRVIELRCATLLSFPVTITNSGIHFFMAPRTRSFNAVYCTPAVALVLVVFCASFGISQNASTNPPAPVTSSANIRNQTETATTTKVPDVSKEALVVDQLHTRIRMESDGTGVRDTTARIRVLSEAGVKAMAVLSFTYSASNEQIDIGYVRVKKSDGSVVATPEYNAQEMPADVSREAPMYSDIHQKQVAVRGLGVGDTLEYQVTQRILKPEVADQFWFEYSFEKSGVVLEEQLDLDLPADKAVIVASADAQPTITSGSGRKLYHWSSSNLSHPDPEAPPKSLKHLKPSVQVTTFSSWEQVGAWYQSLQRESLVVSPAIQARADTLTRGLTNEDDKIRAIFDDVALHVHYVGLDFGIGRYQPHQADDVLASEYGDCKDKHTLVAALLKAAGIDSWPVLISTKRDLDPAVPSPAQFDHVITLVPEGSSLIWMDSTAEVAPVGVLTPRLRDKQGLAIPAEKPAYLVRTPANPLLPGSVRVEVNAQLSGRGVLTGHITQTTEGDVGMVLRLAFRRTPQSQWKEVVQGIVHLEGYGGEASNPQISQVEQIDRPLVMSLDYTREKYYQWDDRDTKHWISPPLPAMGGELAPGMKEQKPGDNPALGAPGKTVYVATLRLPAGWTMTPPTDVVINEDWLEYRATYSFKDGIFAAERSMVVKKSEVSLSQWDRYLAFRRKMFEDWSRQTLISPSRFAVNTTPEQDDRGTVKSDSLPVYSEMSTESDVALTLARGTVVHVGLAVTTDQGRWCSVSNADTSAKLGFVRCDGLDRQTVSSAAPAGSGAVLSTPVDQSSKGTIASCEDLRSVAASGLVSEVESILQTEPDLVKCRGLRGFTPLHTAADKDQTEVVRFLIAHGAEINARTDAGDTPLHWAAFDDRMNAAKLLLAEGAEINPRDKDGNTPLHWAAARGNVEMTELLIAHGADLKTKTRFGCTPLRGAYDYHQMATARVLLAHGATQ